VTDFASNYPNDSMSADEQSIYAHLRSCVKVEPPNLLLLRFRHLFLEGCEYPNPEIGQALARILDSDVVDREFKNILNRCCYILVNQWQNQPRLRSAIPELIALFDLDRVDAGASASPSLQKLIDRFAQTEEYQKLRLLAQKHDRKPESVGETVAEPLQNSIERYPSLYEHCLLTYPVSDLQFQEVRSLRDRRQQKFDADLSQYMTAQFSQKTTIVAPNPTLLGNDQLNCAIRQFSGKVDGTHTYRELAEQFRSNSRRFRSYRTFKEELYEYLSVATDLKYGNGQFDRRLYHHLQGIRSQDDRQKPSELIILETSRKLLDFLVVESPQNPAHYVFWDLHSNLESIPTIGLLLKIILLCRQLKSYLAQRFAILFNHHAAASKSSIGWLVDSLEHLNVAFSLNFGRSNGAI
jgi:hypothetical protein